MAGKEAEKKAAEETEKKAAEEAEKKSAQEAEKKAAEEAAKKNRSAAVPVVIEPGGVTKAEHDTLLERVSTLESSFNKAVETGKRVVNSNPFFRGITRLLDFEVIPVAKEKAPDAPIKK